MIEMAAVKQLLQNIRLGFDELRSPGCWKLLGAAEGGGREEEGKLVRTEWGSLYREKDCYGCRS